MLLSTVLLSTLAIAISLTRASFTLLLTSLLTDTVALATIPLVDAASLITSSLPPLKSNALPLNSSQPANLALPSELQATAFLTIARLAQPSLRTTL